MIGAALAIAALLACNGSTDEHVVAAHLDRLRHEPSADASRTLATLLPEQSPLYRGRGPNEVARLRTYLFATLADVGPPAEALPHVLGELRFGHRVDLLAASARAAGAMGSAARPAVPALLRILSPAFHDDQVCLNVYEAYVPCADPTTARLEAVRALGRIGPQEREAVSALRVLAESEPAGPAETELALRREAQRALSLTEETFASMHETHDFASAWIASRERVISPFAATEFTAQNGRQLGFGELSGEPLAMTFAYTRCDNPNKCPVTIASMARLQRSLRNARLDREVRLAVVTLDPQYDDGARLALFGNIHGFQLTDRALMLRASAEDLERLERTLDVPVNHGAGQINGHAVVLYLFDRQGRYVRRYQSAGWDDADVVADLKRLVAESR
jgi:protein SCO1/2